MNKTFTLISFICFLALIPFVSSFVDAAPTVGYIRYTLDMHREVSTGTDLTHDMLIRCYQDAAYTTYCDSPDDYTYSGNTFNTFAVGQTNSSTRLILDPSQTYYLRVRTPVWYMADYDERGDNCSQVCTATGGSCAFDSVSSLTTHLESHTFQRAYMAPYAANYLFTLTGDSSYAYESGISNYSPHIIYHYIFGARVTSTMDVDNTTCAAKNSSVWRLCLCYKWLGLETNF
mgnify:CR=1 FL=1